MLSLKLSTIILLLAITRIECSGLHPVLPAPVISYAKSVPYNIPPFAASVNIFSRLAAPIPRPIIQSPTLLAAAPAAPQLPYIPLPYPQARSIHPPSIYPFPGSLSVPTPVHETALPVPVPLPGPYSFQGPAALPGPYSLSGPLPLSGLFPLGGSPHQSVPAPIPPPVPVSHPQPGVVYANSLPPSFPALPNVNPYATPLGPPTNVLAPPFLK